MTGLYRKTYATPPRFRPGCAGGDPGRGEGPGSGEVTAVSLAPSAGKRKW